MECSLVRLRVAIAREMDGRGTARRHRHRVPLGLLMMHQGWISSSQLRSALEAQRIAGTGRLGQWLVRQKAVTEEMVAKALGLQWSCPVLNLELQSSAIVPTAMQPLALMQLTPPSAHLVPGLWAVQETPPLVVASMVLTSLGLTPPTAKQALAVGQLTP